jgi:hypothetical protein
MDASRDTFVQIPRPLLFCRSVTPPKRKLLLAVKSMGHTLHKLHFWTSDRVFTRAQVLAMASRRSTRRAGWSSNAFPFEAHFETSVFAPQERQRRSEPTPLAVSDEHRMASDASETISRRAVGKIASAPSLVIRLLVAARLPHETTMRAARRAQADNQGKLAKKSYMALVAKQGQPWLVLL